MLCLFSSLHQTKQIPKKIKTPNHPLILFSKYFIFRRIFINALRKMSETSEKETSSKNPLNKFRSRVTPTTTQYDTVSLVKHIPNVKGKYLWFDGCMYDTVLGKGVLGRVNAGRFDKGLGDEEVSVSGSGSVSVLNNGNGNGNGKGIGKTVCKGDKNYDLIVSLQLGIRYSLGKYSSTSRELKSSDFDPMQKFWTKFPPQGSKLTPTHKAAEFRWKDYCPWVFRNLRDLFRVDPAEYMLAICGNDALRELSSPGKSGSFFYLTQDDKFMIKTVKKSEVKVLLRMLPSYYQHVCQYENSLVTKFYGVHCVKPAGGPKTRFIVMGNLFCSEYRIHRRFDLKGSRHGRTIEKADCEIDESTTLKDLDLDFVFRLQKNYHQELIKQVERDCEFLEAERIMDYSLLIGIHFRNNTTGDKMGLSSFALHGEKDSFRNEKYLCGQPLLVDSKLQDMDCSLGERETSIRLGMNMPARAERLARRSDFDQYIAGGFENSIPSGNSEIYEVVLFYGIIDILQDYDMSKRLEHAYKSLQVDPTSISAVDPKSYSRRFREFMGRIFVEDK